MPVERHALFLMYKSFNMATEAWFSLASDATLVINYISMFTLHQSLAAGSVFFGCVAGEAANAQVLLNGTSP